MAACVGAFAVREVVLYVRCGHIFSQTPYVVGTVGVLERVEICVGVKKSGCGTGTRDTADSGRRVTLISVTSVSLADACRF